MKRIVVQRDMGNRRMVVLQPVPSVPFVTGLQIWRTLTKKFAVGGMLWMVDYRIPFFGGAGISLASLVLTQWIKTGRGEAALSRPGPKRQ